MLTSKQVITGTDELAAVNTDWTKQYAGTSKLMLRPRTTEEVAAVLKYCNQERLALVPQGGNTGLVGGSIPVFDEVILSMSAMNRILGFDESYGIITAESGVILQDM